MPTVSRQATPEGEAEKMILLTKSGGDSYEYVAELREHPTDDAEGLAVVVSRRRFTDGGVEGLDPSATDAVRDHLAEQGYRVETAE